MCSNPKVLASDTGETSQITLHDLCFDGNDIPISDFNKTSCISAINRIIASPLICSDTTLFASLDTKQWSRPIHIHNCTRRTNGYTPDNVQAHLKQLKVDLIFGSEGLPPKKRTFWRWADVIYVYNAQHQRIDDDSFDWLYPIPGDWHLLKLTAKQLRDIMWDGRAKTVCC